MNDPTNWNASDHEGSFEFKTPEDAKKAEEVMNRALRESFENGRKIGMKRIGILHRRRTGDVDFHQDVDVIPLGLHETLDVYMLDSSAAAEEKGSE